MTKPSYGLIHELMRLLLHPWISRVRILNADLEELKQLESDGQLIFVGHAASFVDFFIINHQLRRHGFRELHFTHGFNPFLVLPVRQAFKVWTSHLFRKEETKREMKLEALYESAAQGGHGLVFLKKGIHFLGYKVRYYHGFFGRLAHQNDQKRPIYLIPTSVFLTRMRKKNTKRNFYDIFFGTYDIPSLLRKVYQLLIHYRKGGTVFSKHIDLNRELAQNPELAEKRTEKKLRWTLMFHLNNEDRAYRGPTKRSLGRKVRKILKERRLNAELARVAERTGRTQESVLKEAGKTLHDIGSDTSERVINIMRTFFDYVWTRTLEDIDFKQRDLDRIRELNKQGPVVFLPCHRSHVDYLVVAYLFEKQGLHFPRFAAGDNLSKWPLGPVLRRCGAFFIRRSFKGEPIFPLVFDAYIRHVLRERHVLIFFMEGGRSRTGKLLHPKVGMMSMVLDAWRQGIVDDLPLVPVTIDYGKVFEGQAYLREKSGLEKQKENLRSVLQSRKVLKRKHGVMRLRFGDPIYLSNYVSANGLSRENLGFKSKLPLLNKLSHEVLEEINRRVTLTAGNIIAGLLLGNPKRGMTLADLKALFIISVRFFRHKKVELSFGHKKLELAMNNALDTFDQWETLVRVNVGGEVVVNIPEAKRSEMEYYKNNGLHFVLPVSLFCMGFQILPRDQRTMDQIGDFSRKVYALLDHEFLPRGDYPTPPMVETAFDAMARIDGLKREGDTIAYGSYPHGRYLVQINSRLLINFLESYFVVAEVLTDLLPEETLDKKQVLKHCMIKARLLFAVGTLGRSESINHVSFDNALKKFSKLGYIRMVNSKGQKYPNVTLQTKKKDEFEATKQQLFQWMHQLE